MRTGKYCVTKKALFKSDYTQHTKLNTAITKVHAQVLQHERAFAKL